VLAPVWFNRLYLVSHLKGTITYWENYPFLSNSAAASSFEKDMRHCIALCEKKQKSRLCG
jgi:hypothetical protein